MHPSDCEVEMGINCPWQDGSATQLDDLDVPFSSIPLEVRTIPQARDPARLNNKGVIATFGRIQRHNLAID
jgi:hypothetical protein